MGKTMGKGVECKQGFTLIELLVVISIIGLLSSVVLSSLNSARAKAEDSKQVQSLNQLKRAMELYYDNNNGLYPDLPVASATYRTNSWDSPSWLAFITYDASKLSTLNPYLSTRPIGKAGAGFPFSGYYYKVSTDRKEYKIVLLGTINNTSNIPTSMSDSFFTGSPAVSVWSSDTAKAWSWWTNPI